jgi:magnesium-transporting ATPase (P-type)
MTVLCRTTVYEYTYLLFWNVFWTLFPVLFIGIFDRNVPERALLQVPELYKYGREGRLFGLERFAWYMGDGIYQASRLSHFGNHGRDWSELCLPYSSRLFATFSSFTPTPSRRRPAKTALMQAFMR